MYTISQEDRFIRMKNRGKQSVKKGIWYFWGKKENKNKQKRKTARKRIPNRFTSISSCTIFR